MVYKQRSKPPPLGKVWFVYPRDQRIARQYGYQAESKGLDEIDLAPRASRKMELQPLAP